MNYNSLILKIIYSSRLYNLVNTYNFYLIVIQSLFNRYLPDI